MTPLIYLAAGVVLGGSLGALAMALACAAGRETPVPPERDVLDDGPWAGTEGE